MAGWPLDRTASPHIVEMSDCLAAMSLAQSKHPDR